MGKVDGRRDIELGHLRGCLAQVPMLMAVSDRAARYMWSFNVYSNESPDALLGKTDLERGEHPSLRALHELKLRVLATGEACVEELELETREGLKTFEITASPLVEHGARVGVATIGMDVSQCEARSRMREEQLRLIAHDLRQPLSVIAFAAARLATMVEANSPVRQLSDSISNSVRMMSRALEDILETGEWETGGMELQRERTDLGPLLRETFTAGVVPTGLLRLRLEVEEPCEVEVDRGKLGRAVLNLVDNALKFSGPDTPVIVRVSREANLLRIVVVDQGPGLDPETAKQVFDKYRASTGSRACGGRGLGLYCARLIVEAHGGWCQVLSAPGQGASFAIELPHRPVDPS